ncbi:response regulator [Simonsiella muelleri]|uniref:response regulator n=1 Tax=Simonsiella muelleri TaxID=72 RepID=UPI0028D239C0|nr:response regulator [Simonsiella muelleri]
MYKLMIVDDSQIIRNRIERAVRDTIIEVVATASNGKEAVELFKLHRPNLITMDLNMPEVDGLTAIRQIIAQDARVSILVVSAVLDKRTGLKALHSGACGFVQKPFTDEKLVIGLNKLINPVIR